MKVMVPFILGISIFGLSALNALRKPFSARSFSSWKDFFVRQSFSLLLLTVGTMYTFLLVSTVSPFKCIKSENYFVLLDLPATKCFDSSWFSWLPLVVCFMIFYGAFLPGLLIYLLLMNKNRYGLHHDAFQKLFGSFVRPYKEEYFWWGFVFVLKRSTFAITGAFLKMKDIESISVFVLVMILVLFLWAEIRCSPFKEDSRLHLSIS
jgi:hypothetical protein